jgi:hypothetical protein
MPRIQAKVALYVFAALLLMLGGLLIFGGYFTSSINHGDIDAGWALIAIGLVIWVAGFLARRHFK